MAASWTVTARRAAATAGALAAWAAIVLVLTASESCLSSGSAPTGSPGCGPGQACPATGAGPTASPVPAARPSAGGYRLTRIMPDVSFERMVDLVPIPGRPNEAIVLLQKEATIWRVSLDDAFAPVLYGDLSAYVGGSGNEEGLLSAAFSPEFETDHRLYVYYTQGGAAGLPTVLARFPASAEGMDTEHQTVLLEVPDFASNHNGGKLLFGPDGYLYLSTGDGGGAGDPQENGQNTFSLLGKILRLDVTAQETYTIPAGNPFAGGGGAPEVWAYGLRNPWRFSFDRLTGDLWAGDVGQDRWEEVDRIAGGGNYGWDCYEGFAKFEPQGCPEDGLQWPRAVYGHDQGAAITGGYVYRGSAMPELYGWYIYADAYSGNVWALDAAPAAESEPVKLVAEPGAQIVSFSETSAGELLLLDLDRGVYRLERR